MELRIWIYYQDINDFKIKWHLDESANKGAWDTLSLKVPNNTIFSWYNGFIITSIIIVCNYVACQNWFEKIWISNVWEDIVCKRAGI